MAVVIDRDAVADAADTAGVDIRESYVFGPIVPDHECFGIEFDSVNQTDLRSFFIELATRDADLAVNLNDACRVDQLGQGWIAYFPNHTLESDEDDGDAPDVECGHPVGMQEEVDGGGRRCGLCGASL